MKSRIRRALGGAAALTIATGILVGAGTAAYAATTPAWEPDSSALGSISFYNSSGAPITGGSFDDHAVAAYSVASGPGRTGDSKAQLKAFTPQVGVLPGLWSGDTLTGSTNYPNAGAPANIAGLTNPVASGTSGDLSLADYIDEFPNNTTAAGYQNLYELRLYTSGVGQSQNISYYRADIQVDPAARTWTVVFPAAATSTSTSIAASPNSPANSGAPVTLTATVTPAGTAGSVHFADGATDLGAASYNAATGVATLTVHPADGSHSFTASFTPTDTGAFTGSTSSALSYTVTPAGTPTSTSLSASPSSPVTADSSGHASVALTATVNPAGFAGSVHFFDGATDLGNADAYTSSTGVATKAVTLTAATHLLTATFTPSGTGVQPSTSMAVSYVVQPVNFGSAGIQVQAQDSTQPFAGSLSLQVVAGTTVNLAQVDPSTPAGHPSIATDPTGHRHAWVFDGNLSGVSVLDSRPAQSGWTVTGQSSDFVNGGTTIASDHLGWNPALATGGDAEGTVLAGTTVNSILQTASSHGLSNPTNLASAATGNGLGTQNLSAALDLRIPDTSPIGLYTSTLTLTLISP